MEKLQNLGLDTRPMPSGRTDLGVHARMQVLSLKVSTAGPLESLAFAWNQALKGQDIGIACVKKAPQGFHAQWQAQMKEYRYRIALGPCPEEWRAYAWNPKQEERLSCLPQPLPERISDLLRACMGTHDFIAFHENSSVRKMRRIESATVNEWAPGIFDIRLRGDSFARYQVRYLVGAVIATAMGLFSEQQFRAAIHSAITLPGIKAPAKGLVLWEVFYPPDVDPFSPDERLKAPGVLDGIPF